MTATAEQFAYMPADTGRRRGYQVVAQSRGVSDDVLAQMEPYMFPAGAGRGFSSSKSLLLLRGGLVAYSNIKNVGDGYDGRPDALYNHTLIMPVKSFEGVGFDTRVLDAYHAGSPPRGALPSVQIGGSAPAPRIGERYGHLVLPVLRALFTRKKAAVPGVDDPEFLPNVLAMLPPSMRLVPFSTCLPDPVRQPAYKLVSHGGRMGSLPAGFARIEHSGGRSRTAELDDAVLFLMERAASGSAGELFSEFDMIDSNTPRARLVMLSRVLGVSDSPGGLRARRARDALETLTAFDEDTRSRMARRLAPFLEGEKTPRTKTGPDAKHDKKIIGELLEQAMRGAPVSNTRRMVESLYRTRHQDFEKNVGSIMHRMADSPHAPDVYGFFAATKELHPSILEFLSGKTGAPSEHRRRVLKLLVPAALGESPGLVSKMLACGVHDLKRKHDARDLLEILAAVARSERAGSDPGLVADALMSAMGKAGGAPRGRGALRKILPT